MRYIAREVRELMAQLGFRTINEMVGRVDRVEPRKAIEHWKARGLDFSKHPAPAPRGRGRGPLPADSPGSRPRKGAGQHHPVEAAANRPWSGAKKVVANLPIRNVNRGRHDPWQRNHPLEAWRQQVAGGHGVQLNFTGSGGPELRRVYSARRNPPARGRCQRLFRQRIVRRQNHRVSAAHLNICSGGKYHHRQRGDVWR